MDNVTHRLLVIGTEVMRLPFTQFATSLTACFPSEKLMKCHETVICNFTHCLFSIRKINETPWDCLSHNLVTHILLVIGKDVTQKVQCHSLAVGHRKICDENAFLGVCNITHWLLVIGKDVMRLPSQNMICKITHILLAIGQDVMRLLSQNG